jgi:exodeoxyribonuclease X
MTAIIFDSETTGLDAPEAIEAAWLPIDIAGNPAGECTVARFQPSKPISTGALATHHIMDEDLVDCPPSASFSLPDSVDYMIGHNVDFDWRVIGEPPVKRIDVLAMCRTLWPDADSFSQGALLYRLERREARALLRGAHSAQVDVMVCQRVLAHVLDALRDRYSIESFDELWMISERMRIPTVMAFGKHKGVAIKSVPADYKRWLLAQPDLDPYLVKALSGAST